MITALQWIGARPAGLKCSGLKRDLPLLNPHQTAIRIAFTFETVYCVKQDQSLVRLDGGLVPVAIVRNAGNSAIGLNDPYQPGESADVRAFRSALFDRAADSPQVWQSAIPA